MNDKTDLYFCPTADEIESASRGGFKVCCAHPGKHIPVPDDFATEAISQSLSEAAKRQYRLRATIERAREVLDSGDEMTGLDDISAALDGGQ